MARGSQQHCADILNLTGGSRLQVPASTALASIEFAIMNPSTQTLLMTAALVVSSLSFIVSGLSLGWQISSWLMSAGRVRVILEQGLLSGGAFYGKPVGRDGRRFAPEALADQGLAGKEVLGVKIVNVGRAPVTISRYGARVHSAGVAVTPVADAIGPNLPYRLEAGESESWYVEMRTAVALLAGAQALKPRAREVCMTAELATGKVKRTRRAVRL